VLSNLLFLTVIFYFFLFWYFDSKLVFIPTAFFMLSAWLLTSVYSTLSCISVNSITEYASIGGADEILDLIIRR